MNPNAPKVNAKSGGSAAGGGVPRSGPKATPEHYDLFADFCVSRLPDSFRIRAIVLFCLLKVLPKQHPRRPLIRELLHLLRAHEMGRDAFVRSVNASSEPVPQETSESTNNHVPRL
jgi:hypothetical protein